MCIPAANQSEIYFNQSLRNCKYFQHSSSFSSDRLAKTQTDIHSTDDRTDRQTNERTGKVDSKWRENYSKMLDFGTWIRFYLFHTWIDAQHQIDILQMLTAPEEAIANWQNHSTEAVRDSSDKTLELPAFWALGSWMRLNCNRSVREKRSNNIMLKKILHRYIVDSHTTLSKSLILIPFPNYVKSMVPLFNQKI